MKYVQKPLWQVQGFLKSSKKKLKSNHIQMESFFAHPDQLVLIKQN